MESGTEEGGAGSTDAALLALCAQVPVEQVRGYTLAEPLAPVVAARRAGVVLHLAGLDAGAAALAGRGLPIVEGVGGALVELCEGLMVADLPRRWGLRALVVAGNRLGALSHTLLTVEALQARGADVAGVVLNTLHPDPPSTGEATNADELRRLLPADVPLLGTVPFVLERSPDALAGAVASLADALFPSRMALGRTTRGTP